jgi:alkanesulfonate monooxygenase SsuD/methylene tetrahydromethanopterin reductase-like flavin-dependent oxidoreductase (luciferase family)
VIASTEAEVERKLADLRRARSLDEERLRSYVIAGTPAQVTEQVEAYLDAGLDGMVFNMHDAQELEPVALAGETLAPVRAPRLGSGASEPR